MAEHFSSDEDPFGRFPLWIAKAMLKQLLLAIHDLHSIGVCHADLQPGKILFALRSPSELERVGLSSPPDAEYISPRIVRLDGKPDWWT